MSKETIIKFLDDNWENGLIKYFKPRNADATYELLTNLPNSFTFHKEDFDDYTESIRMAMDTLVLEIHHSYGYIMLIDDPNEKVLANVKFKKGNKKSLDKAMIEVLAVYFEYLRDFYEARYEEYQEQENWSRRI